MLHVCVFSWTFIIDPEDPPLLNIYFWITLISAHFVIDAICVQYILNRQMNRRALRAPLGWVRANQIFLFMNMVMVMSMFTISIGLAPVDEGRQDNGAVLLMVMVAFHWLIIPACISCLIMLVLLHARTKYTFDFLLERFPQWMPMKPPPRSWSKSSRTLIFQNETEH